MEENKAICDLWNARLLAKAPLILAFSPAGRSDSGVDGRATVGVNQSILPQLYRWFKNSFQMLACVL